MDKESPALKARRLAGLPLEGVLTDGGDATEDMLLPEEEETKYLDELQVAKGDASPINRYLKTLP